MHTQGDEYENACRREYVGGNRKASMDKMCSIDRIYMKMYVGGNREASIDMQEQLGTKRTNNDMCKCANVFMCSPHTYISTPVPAARNAHAPELAFLSSSAQSVFR